MSFHGTDRPLKTLGDFEILGKIASRGQRSVYKARRQTTDEIVALKAAPVHLLSSPLLRDQFAEEFLVANAIQHPNLVRCLALEYEEATPYLVLEYIGGETLADRIARQGRLDENEAIRLLCQVAMGVQAIHERGVVHGDIKPANILIAPDGQAKLADLGLVRQEDAELELPNPRTMLTTLNYVAPEQFEDWRLATARGDIYSLGAILYFAVTGALPFRANGALGTLRRKLNNEFVATRHLVPTLSERTERAIGRAIHVDLSQRPLSCLEWIADLTEEPFCSPAER